MIYFKRVAIILSALLPAFGSADQPPSIVFIVADDMGYADISSFGAPDLKTPNIDQLAADGAKFTNIYAMGPECTPSRVSFLTGRYPQRVGGLECAIGTGNVGRYDDAIRLAEDSDLGLPPEYAVLAPQLKKAGYYNGVFGKWHLGYEPKFLPLEQGFGEFVGFLGGNVDYFRHKELSEIPVYYSIDKPIEREGYTTDLITEDAVAFLESRSKEPAKPFFLYLPHAAPHFPFQGPDEDPGGLPSVEEWTLGTRESYIAMMTSLDDSVGAVVEKLESSGLSENTIVVFTSDHGAMVPGLNDPWRDYKGTLFEGGVRVPLLVKWPGKIKPGPESDQVGSLMELTRSFLNVAGAKLPQGLTLDDDDLLEHLRNGDTVYPRELNWRARRGDRTQWAIRDGDYKYMRRTEGGETEEWLFNLKADPTETTNLLEGEPKEKVTKIADRLRKKNQAWETKVKPER